MSEESDDEYILYDVLINEISSLAFDSHSPYERNELITEVYDLIEEEDIRLELVDFGEDVGEFFEWIGFYLSV